MLKVLKKGSPPVGNIYEDETRPRKPTSFLISTSFIERVRDEK